MYTIDHSEASVVKDVISYRIIDNNNVCFVVFSTLSKNVLMDHFFYFEVLAKNFLNGLHVKYGALLSLLEVYTETWYIKSQIKQKVHFDVFLNEEIKLREDSKEWALAIDQMYSDKKNQIINHIQQFNRLAD
jgi:hypothetical protein